MQSRCSQVPYIEVPPSKMTTIFGQLVVGPPGSGKSTYCKYICDNLRQLGRNAKIINLDPANDCLPYKPTIDIRQLITIERVMSEAKLGPNGSLIHCVETLDENFAWLYDKIVTLLEEESKLYQDREKLLNDGDPDKSTTGDESSSDSMKNRPYLLFDCPGQSELYTHHRSFKGIIRKLLSNKSKKHFDLRLVCMNLCDAYHASDLGKYMSLVMTALATMANLELPHVNVLSKVDKMESYGKTRFNLDFYCEVMDIKYLLDTELDSPFFEKYRKLSLALADIIQDYGLVTFIPLNIQQAEDILKVLQSADRANGYLCDDVDLAILQLNPNLMEMASGRRLESLKDATIQI